MFEMTLNRAGVIIVKPEQGTCYQCVVKGHTTYYYKTVMTFHDPFLDARGFLADHGEISTLISQIYAEKSVPSCEVMVMEIAKRITDFLIAANMPPYSVFVEITNIPEGSQGFINTTYYPNKFI